MKHLVLGSVSVPVALVAADRDPPVVITRLRVQAISHSPSEVPGEKGVLCFGPAPWLDEAVRRRWIEELAPAIQAGLSQLNIEAVCWRIRLRLPDAAAHLEQPCILEGPSADAALCVALIASAIGLRVRNDTLVTGSVSLADERLGVVGALPEKLVASGIHPSIRRFVHAPIDTDGSVAWTPKLWDRWDAACRRMARRVRLHPCEDLTTAIRHLIHPDSRVITALQHHWVDKEPEDHMTGWAKWLMRIDLTIWRRRLDRRLRQGRRDDARRLLDARVHNAIQLRAYPAGLGGALTTALRAVPRGRRRTQLRGVLIKPDLLARCIKLAGKKHRQDARRLVSAARGCVAGPASGTGPVNNDADDHLDWLLERLAGHNTAQRLDRPLDAARLSFRVRRSTVRDTDEFLDLLTSFYTHMCRHAGLSATVDADDAAAEALNLLNQAYRREGGVRAALADARDGTRGGVRGVLDAMTDAMKSEKHQMDTLHSHVLAIDPVDFNSALSMTGATLDRLRAILPKQYRDLPPEQAVAELENLIQESVQAGDRLARRLRSR